MPFDKGLKNLLNRAFGAEFEKQQILNWLTDIRMAVSQKDEPYKAVQGELRLQRNERKGKPVGRLLLI